MAISDLYYSFSGKPPKREVDQYTSIDEDLEALIDRAGREKVFATAEAIGWAGQAPPKWVWRSIASDIINGRVK